MRCRSLRHFAGFLLVVFAHASCSSVGGLPSSPAVVAPPPPELRATPPRFVRPAVSLPDEGVPDYAGDTHTRSRLSGDWGGTRTRLAEQGLTFDLDLTLIGQSVLGDGGLDDGDAVTLSGDLVATLDTERMGLWRGGSLVARIEGRAGDSVILDAGTISPVNTDAVLPPDDLDEEILALTEVTYTHTLDERFSVFGGLLQNFDRDENPFASGRGSEMFMNMAFVISPVIFRGVPYSTLGLGVDFTPNEQWRGTVALMDTEESTDRSPFGSGDGTTVLGEVRVTYDFSGLPGGDMLGLVYADGDFPPLDRDIRLTFPPGSAPQNNKNTWALYYNFYQYLFVLDETDGTKGWGLFGRFDYADDDVNPIQWLASFGLGGEGFLLGRPDDRFGFGYYYLGVADDAQIRALSVDDEHGVELFYDFAITPTFSLTPDVQFINGGFPGSSDAWVVALRAFIRI